MNIGIERICMWIHSASYCCAVQEAVIALVGLYQHFTFRLSENCSEPLSLQQGITLAPKDGVPVHLIERHKAQAF